MNVPIPLLIVFYLVFPAFVIHSCRKSSFLDKLGAVVICYLAGIAIGNIGILPPDAGGLLDTMSGVIIALALPLVLFSMDIPRWIRLAGRTILSMLFATVAVLICAVIGFLVVMAKLDTAWQVAGMAVGVYTGGTPNMASIKTALGVEPDLYIITHTYDTIISAVYLAFLITAAQRLFNRFLPPFKSGNNRTMGEAAPGPDAADPDPSAADPGGVDEFQGIFSRRVVPPLLGAFGLSIIIFATGFAATFAVPEDLGASTAILVITTLGICASFVPRVRHIDKSFQLGMYLIYAFCLVVASMANLRILININWTILLYITFAIFGSMMIHALLCRLAGIDTDTFLITSVSAVCSPPFVPVVAGALKNREVIISGLTTGIIGYAIGNYLGILTAQVLRSLFQGG